jgi:hypothetical protein
VRQLFAVAVAGFPLPMEVLIFVVERRTQFYFSRYDVPTVFSREYTSVVFRNYALRDKVAPRKNRVREYCRAYHHGGLTYCLISFVTRFISLVAGVIIVESSFLENHVESWWLKKQRWVCQGVGVVTSN